MSNIIKVPFFLICFISIGFAAQSSGQKIFEQYCWGCHHQTATAFGPSFEDIANKRSLGEIEGHIIAPKATYKQLGYKRSVMPSFKDKLSTEELNTIANYILQYRSK